jgi:hypothetical protein
MELLFQTFSNQLIGLNKNWMLASALVHKRATTTGKKEGNKHEKNMDCFTCELDGRKAKLHK